MKNAQTQMVSENADWRKWTHTEIEIPVARLCATKIKISELTTLYVHLSFWIDYCKKNIWIDYLQKEYLISFIVYARSGLQYADPAYILVFAVDVIASLIT